jgi:predicted nucleic acid-binding protein
MPPRWIADSPVLVDLDHGGIVEPFFRLPMLAVVSDDLFSEEILVHFGTTLCGLGLRVELLSRAAALLAESYVKIDPDLSGPDASLLALAKEGNDILLAGDQTLVELAGKVDVDVHGVLWVLDRLEAKGLLGCEALHAALSQMLAHSRCRLPRRPVAERLRRYGCGEQR